MPQHNTLATDDDPETATDGVVITQRLVSIGVGRPATGTFTAVGALAGSGTVSAGDWASVPRAVRAGSVLIDGTERLASGSGELEIALRASLRAVPDTGILTGGGAWNIASATGDYDGARAAGTLTATATVDESGTVTIDLLLTGRTPRRAGLTRPDERRVSDA
jgi:hypothetical protein